MADDGWQSRSHADIVGKLGALKADNAFTLANTWSDVYTKLSDAAVSYGNAKSKLAEPDFWTGKGPEAALDEMTTKERELTSESGTSAKAGKMSTALFQDGEVLSQSSRVAQAYPVPPDDTDADSKRSCWRRLELRHSGFTPRRWRPTGPSSRKTRIPLPVALCLLAWWQ